MVPGGTLSLISGQETRIDLGKKVLAFAEEP
jgi:hypothetical protein